jgi:hypothetical protein
MAEQTKGARIAAIIFGLAALAAAAWWVTSNPGEPERRRAAEMPPVDVTPRRPGLAGWSIEPGMALAIARSELPERGIVPIDLDLGEPSTTTEPLSGRILSFDESRSNRERPLLGKIITDDRATTRVGLPADFLTPGTYLIEIRTTEESHFPLRRYRLEVR